MSLDKIIPVNEDTLSNIFCIAAVSGIIHAGLVAGNLVVLLLLGFGLPVSSAANIAVSNNWLAVVYAGATILYGICAEYARSKSERPRHDRRSAVLLGTPVLLAWPVLLAVTILLRNAHLIVDIPRGLFLTAVLMVFIKSCERILTFELAE